MPVKDYKIVRWFIFKIKSIEINNEINPLYMEIYIVILGKFIIGLSLPV